MNLKFFIVLIVFECCVLLAVVYGFPNEDTLKQPDLTGISLNRTKRASGNILTWSAKEAAKNAFRCAKKTGCHKGYCWAWCGTSLSGTFGEWCYTTKSFSKSFRHVACKKNTDCDPCWKCAGLCHIIHL